MKTLCFLAACMLSAACAHQPPPETLPTFAITEANGGRYRVTFHAPQSSTRWWVMVCDGDPYHSRSCDVNDSMVQGPEGQGWLRSFPVEIRLRSLQPDCRPADTQPPSNSWFAVESPTGVVARFSLVGRRECEHIYRWIEEPATDEIGDVSRYVCRRVYMHGRQATFACWLR